jgi:hypothetical protein
LPNTKATGQILVVDVARTLRRHREDPIPGAAEMVDRRRRRDVADDRQVEQGAGRRADGLGVVDVDRGLGEHDAAGAGRVRRPEHRAGVPGVADLVQHRHAPVGRQPFEAHVDVRHDAHESLGRHGRGELAHHVLGHQVDLGTRASGLNHEGIDLVDGEQDLEHALGREGLAYGLRALREEPAVLLPEGVLLQADGLRDLRVLGGRDHTSPLEDRRAGV